MHNIFDNNDIILEILSKSDPLSVINLCRITSKTTEYLDNLHICSQLMKLHYPYAKITTNPKNQYLALVNGITHSYQIEVDSIFDNHVTDSNGNKFNLKERFSKYTCHGKFEPLYKLNIVIKGTKPINNEIYWILVKSAHITTDTEIFTTKEDAVNYFLNTQYNNIINSILLRYYKFCCKLSSNLDQFGPSELKSYLIENKHPHDLSREGLYNYIMTNSFYNFIPKYIYDDDIVNNVIYQFIDVTIYNV